MKLVLGSAQFGMKYGVANRSGQVVASEIGKILRTAQRAGINTVDTAMAYGSSEKSLGDFGMSSWNVITKLPEIPDADDLRGWIAKQLSASCAKLGLKQLHGLLLHRPTQLSGNRGGDIWDIMLKLKREEKVKKIGISIYSLDELDYVKNKEIDIIQVPVNIFDRSLERSGLAPELKARGIEIHARSVFLQGLLLMDPVARPEYFRTWDNIFTIYDTWIKNNNITRLQASFGYVNSLPFVDRVVVGVESSRQLEVILSTSFNVNITFPMFSKSDLGELINPSKWDLR